MATRLKAFKVHEAEQLADEQKVGQCDGTPQPQAIERELVRDQREDYRIYNAICPRQVRTEDESLGISAFDHDDEDDDDDDDDDD